MTISIYFSDLIPATQAELLSAANIADPEEANWDVIPLFELEVAADTLHFVQGESQLSQHE